MCVKPHNEVLKYFMSRKLHTNTGSSVFLTEGRSLCCGTAGTDGLLRLTGAKELAVPTLFLLPGLSTERHQTVDLQGYVVFTPS